MAAPQRRYPTPNRGRAAARPIGARRAGARKQASGRRRRFAVVVVVPVLLMLGSVYLHTLSARLEGEVADLEERLDRAATEGERWGIRVAELSRADRIRPLASERLGMRDPEGADLEVYESEGEDGTRGEAEEEGGHPR
jgi:cell division protein FtsL